MEASDSREEEQDDCSCARRTHAIRPQRADATYKKINKEEAEHLPPPRRPRAAISRNNGGREQRKKAQHKASTRIVGPHVGGEGAEEEEGKASSSTATLRGGKIQSQPIPAERNRVRGRAGGLATAANCHGGKQEATRHVLSYSGRV